MLNKIKILLLFYLTTLILYNLGIDKVGHTQQLKKHKTMKICVIYDEFKVPIMSTNIW